MAGAHTLEDASAFLWEKKKKDSQARKEKLPFLPQNALNLEKNPDVDI